MNERTKINLRDIAFQTNALVDGGATISLDKVHDEIEAGTIIKWLSDSGEDMSILLSDEMDDVKAAVVEVLRRVGNSLAGRERRKLGVENNGFCFLIGLVCWRAQSSGPRYVAATRKAGA